MSLNTRCSLTNERTGERLDFPTVTNADFYLQRTSGYIRSCFYKDIKATHKITKEKYTYEFGESYVAPTGRFDTPMTICWECKNAVGGCFWSRVFEPVPGWEAEPTKIKYYNQYEDSFIVKSCPEFVKG